MNKWSISMFKILIICLLVSLTFCSYSKKNSLSFSGYAPTSFALAPKPVSLGSDFDVAVGLFSGNVRIASTTDNRASYYEFNISSSPIIFVDWHDAGICAATSNQVKVIDPTSMSIRQTLNFTGTVLKVACAYRSTVPAKILTALAFSNRI